MDTVVRHVRDIAPADRRVLEHVIGRSLEEDQEVIIQVVTPQAEGPSGQLPAWCNVFAGLTGQQVDEVEGIIRQRSDLTRPSE
jgi:hypothetical protein